MCTRTVPISPAPTQARSTVALLCLVVCSDPCCVYVCICVCAARTPGLSVNAVEPNTSGVAAVKTMGAIAQALLAHGADAVCGRTDARERGLGLIVVCMHVHVPVCLSVCVCVGGVGRLGHVFRRETHASHASDDAAAPYAATTALASCAAWSMLTRARGGRA
jgi:hypothetical protein